MREAIEMQLRTLSMKRDKGFSLAKIDDTSLREALMNTTLPFITI